MGVMRILFTREDGGVSICCPSPEFLSIATNGGGFVPASRVKIEIEKLIAAGIKSDVARRHIMAMAFGGLVTAEAFGVIRDKDCPGTGHEIVDPMALPDRWFRNAWRRRRDGGPIWIDLDAAKECQAAKAADRRTLLLTRITPRAMLGDNWASWLHGELRDMDLMTLGRKFAAASSPDELRSLWPEILN